MNILNKKKQQGAETLEFIVVFGMFMGLVITVFDFGRALYTWNALTEATRRGARMAVICPVDKNSTTVKNVAVFDTLTSTAAGNSQTPIINGLTRDAINIRYLNKDGNEETDANLVKFVEVSIDSDEKPETLDKYTFESIIPFKLFNPSGINHKSISSPTFKTTLPTESKGAVPYYKGDYVNPPSPSCIF